MCVTLCLSPKVAWSSHVWEDDSTAALVWPWNLLYHASSFSVGHLVAATVSAPLCDSCALESFLEHPRESLCQAISRGRWAELQKVVQLQGCDSIWLEHGPLTPALGTFMNCDTALAARAENSSLVWEPVYFGALRMVEVGPAPRALVWRTRCS